MLVSMRAALFVVAMMVPLYGRDLLQADEPNPSEQSYNPTVAAASDEAERSIARIRVPADLEVELFAAEPLLANPVAFCIDERGRFYVAETYRLHEGVTDIRSHMTWLDDELAS